MPRASRPLHGRGRVLPLILLILLVLLAACGEPADAVCTPIRFSELAADRFSSVASRLDFEPQRPCASRAGFEVTEVFEYELPGAQRRVHFVVQWRGQPAFTFSQTRALVPFSQIPQGTHRLRVAGPEVIADGFAGPSGSGTEIAYLRWRTADLTFELSATLHPWFAERDVVALITSLLRRPEAVR